MLVYVTSSKREMWDPKIQLQKGGKHDQMHTVILAIRVTCSWCTRVLQNDTMPNPVSKKTEDSMLRTKRLSIMSDLKSTYFHRQFMIIKKITTEASFHSLRLAFT